MSLIETPLDVLIIGGGPAGLSAALYLGRGRRSALVVDAGGPRHAPSRGVHNFLTREGVAPAELRELAWADLQEFPTIDRLEARIVDMTHDGTFWNARTESGHEISARAVILALGVVDIHPDIPGYAERWARSIHHCPFCHGWEVRDMPVAMVGSGDYARHMAPMLKNWTDDVMLLSHGEPLDDETLEMLDAKGIPHDSSPIVALEGPEGSLETIVLADGTRLARRGLFVKPGQRQHDLIGELGLPMNGDFIEVDMMQRTTLPMLWAAGDCTTGFQQVLEGAAQGARAAASIIMTLAMSAD